jgi:hypothetical protein
MTEVLNGTASLEPAYNIIERTFMVANYGANGGCVDNDDGKQAWHAARKSLSSSCLGLKPDAAHRCCRELLVQPHRELLRVRRPQK